MEESVGDEDFGFLGCEELFEAREARVVFVGDVAEGCGFKTKPVFCGLESVSDEPASLESGSKSIEQGGFSKASVLADDDTCHSCGVIHWFGSAGRKVICPPHTDPSQDESKHFLLGFGEDCENIAKLNLTQRRVKPIPVRNPDTRVENNFATPAPSWVKGVSIVKCLVNVFCLVHPLHFKQAFGE